MNKEIWVRFYQVECPEGVHLQSVLSRIRRKNALERTIEINNIPIIMARIRRDEDFYQGEVIKIRMDGLPGVVRRGADDIDDLNIQIDQGLGEESAFLYHIPTNIFVYQSNVSGVREAALCRYLLNFSDVDQPFILRPVLRQDAYTRYDNMQLFRKVEIKLASGMPPDIDESENELFSDICRNMRRYSSGSIKLDMSVDSPHDRKSTLDNIRPLVDFFSNLLSSNEVDVQTLKVSGKQNELMSVETIDLIDDVMKERETLHMSSRRYPYSTRKDAVRNAWDKNSAELISRFSS